MHYKQRLTKLWLILCSATAISACAEVYQWQDGRGRSHFSDHEQVNSKKLAIKPGYSWVEVEYVYDGDTIKINDGRKVRLLGINAPEVHHRNQETETGGEEAKAWLTKKLRHAKVRVVSDVEARDKYQRELAHVFTQNNEHINLQLVEQGLAEVNIYPPNLLYADQLIDAENRAETAKLGIWGQPEYTVIPVDQIKQNDLAGWVRISGQVRTKRSSRKYVYLEFSKEFQVRIDKKWLRLFPELETYIGQNLEVRGWVNKVRERWIMVIRHPSAIKIRQTFP